MSAPSAASVSSASSATSTASFSGLVRRGARGYVVKQIQWRTGVSADGVFGPMTESAVKRYQRRNGLGADGVRGGISTEESLQTAKWLEEDGGLDAIELTAGSSLVNPMYLFRGDAPVKQFAGAFKPPLRWGIRMTGKKFLREYPYREAYLLRDAKLFRAELTMPLILLAAGKDAQAAPRFEAQKQQAMISTRGSAELVPDSGHMMMFDRPDAIIAAIRTVADEARTPPPSKGE